jgi:tetratricopeptide (TPR) repeat protein
MEEAIAEHKLARKYDPFNPLHTAYLGGLYHYDGQHEKALEYALESFKLQEDYSIGYLIMGRALLGMGKTKEAIDAHEKLVELYPWYASALGETYYKTGYPEKTEKILTDLLKDPHMDPYKAWQITNLAAVMGKNDIAFEYLNREPHHAFIAWAAVLTRFNKLHDDPRWAEFIDRLNLPD